MPKIETVVVLGSGSFGTALAATTCWRGLKTTLWGRDPDTIEEINRQRTNQAYLPGQSLPETLRATTDPAVCQEADLLIIAVPSQQFRKVSLLVAEQGLAPDCITLSASKGIEMDTGSLMTQILSEVFPGRPCAVISGPSHAEELVCKLPTAVVIGCSREDIGVELQQVFTLPWFRSYTSTDVVGIEVGGTVKNIAAIAGGVVEGLGMGDNAKAGLVTRGLAEMVRLGISMGARGETFMGLSGVGDLMVTCFSDHSRNTRFGRMLGQGLSLEEARRKMKMVAEGVPNTSSVYHFAKKNGVRTPVTDLLYELLHGRLQVQDAAQALLSRSPRSEQE